jgi:hypothetical protein
MAEMKTIYKNKLPRPLDPTCTRMFDGSYEVSAIVYGYRMHQRYYRYSKREAIAQFRQYCLERINT